MYRLFSIYLNFCCTFFISSNIDLVPVLSIHCCGIITACLSSPWTIGFTGTHPSMAAVRTESTILSGARPHHRASAESRKRILTPPLPWTFPWCPADTMQNVANTYRLHICSTVVTVSAIVVVSAGMGGLITITPLIMDNILA